tara:strand:- start:2477 stop:2731 length:255 start_codon:yes stop_codon:yes gene_type:complete
MSQITRKHFIAISKMIHFNKKGSVIVYSSFVDDMCEYFKEQNSRFSFAIFKDFCELGFKRDDTRIKQEWEKLREIFTKEDMNDI